MPEHLTGGDTTMVITLDDIRSYIIGRTLADEDVPEGGLVLRAITKHEVAKLWDVKPEEIELIMFDSMHVLLPQHGKEPADAWEIDFLCHVWCDYCDRIAIRQATFGSNLCEDHFNEANEQHWADLANDDRAIGLG